MSYSVVENPVTGERGIVRVAPTGPGAPLVADLYARPGAAVVGEHTHPYSTETFTVMRGLLGVRLDGRESHAARAPASRCHPAPPTTGGTPARTPRG